MDSLFPSWANTDKKKELYAEYEGFGGSRAVLSTEATTRKFVETRRNQAGKLP